jgi:hypothetical protein
MGTIVALLLHGRVWARQRRRGVGATMVDGGAGATTTDGGASVGDSVGGVTLLPLELALVAAPLSSSSRSRMEKAGAVHAIYTPGPLFPVGNTIRD